MQSFCGTMLFLFLSFFSFYHLWYNRREVNKVISIVSLHRQCFTKQGVRYRQRSDNVNQTPQTLWARVRLMHIRREEPSQPRWAGPSSPPLQALRAWGKEALLFPHQPRKNLFPRATYKAVPSAPPLPSVTGLGPDPRFTSDSHRSRHPLQHPWHHVLDVISLSHCLLQTPG